MIEVRNIMDLMFVLQTVPAKEDDSGTAVQVALSLNKSPQSKNYGQSIQR